MTTTPHQPGQNTALVTAALPGVISALSDLLNATGLPPEQRPTAIKGVLSSALGIAAPIGETLFPQFAPIIDVLVKGLEGIISNAGGVQLTAAERAEALQDIADGYAAGSTVWADAGAKPSPGGAP